MPHTDEWKDGWKFPVMRHGRMTRWNWVVIHPEKLTMGKYVDVGALTLIVATYGVILEDDVEIGSHVAIYSENSSDLTQGPVVLRKGCRIGSHTSIFPNVTIGEGAVVGAYSLVKSDIPTGMIAYGIPAKVIGNAKPG